MLFQRTVIAGTEIVQPPVRMTSEEIEEQLKPLYDRVRLPAGRLELMTGIESRHFWEDSRLPSAASAEAGKLLLEKMDINADEIDLLIHCGVCRDRLEPATAAYVHGLLRLSPNCQFLDVSNACLGFVNAIVLAAGLIESGQIKRALLVSGENGKSLLERTIERLNQGDLSRNGIKPYFANLTIGAGAVAMMLTEASLSDPSLKLVGGVSMSDSSANTLCQGDAANVDSLDMLTEAEELLEKGIQLAQATFKKFITELNWSVSEITRTICHQVGRTHQRKLLESLGLNEDIDFVTYPYMGNVGSVSLPFTLHKAIQENAVKQGDRVAMLGIGSGLSSVILGVEG